MPMLSQHEVQAALDAVAGYAEARGFAGPDPYDVLASPLPLRALPPVVSFALTQLHKRNPLSLRRVLRIPPVVMPKGIGLFLKAYALRHQRPGGPDYGEQMAGLFDWIVEHSIETEQGWSWGLPFAYSSLTKFQPPNTPSAVVTAFIHDGVCDYLQATGDERARAVIEAATAFVVGELPRTERAAGLCFSYTPIQRDECFNANALIARLLARSYALTGEESLRDLARQSVAYTVAKQQSEGFWNYRVKSDGTEKRQIDFHQGFILDSLVDYLAATGDDDPAVRAALDRGAAFYRTEQFTDEGRSLWRWPKPWPVDIHNQAQGIITFSKLGDLDTATRIADWTLRHMRGPDGAFYHRVGRVIENRVRHMRWGQAWMTLALSHLMVALDAAEPAPHAPANLTPTR